MHIALLYCTVYLSIRKKGVWQLDSCLLCWVLFVTNIMSSIQSLVYSYLVFFGFARSWRYVYRVMGELSEALCTSRAADPNNEPSEICDQIFNSITSNIDDCDYIDFYDNSSNLWNGNDSLILVHLNIRSLHKNFDDLHEFGSMRPFKPDVICLSESRINHPLKNIQLQGYNFFSVSLHLAEKHFPENYFLELAFAINHTCQNEHLPEITSTRTNTCLKTHLPE